MRGREMTEMQSKPIQELLTPREYNLFLRFGVGPAEKFRNDSQREAYRLVCDKIAAEQRRAAKAERDFFLECAAAVDALIPEEKDAAERKRLRGLAKGFREQAARGMDNVRRNIRRWRARVRRQLKAQPHQL